MTRCKYDNKFMKLDNRTETLKVLPIFCVLIRIYCEDKNSFLQDCEDDGETAAGGRLLHLLQVNLDDSSLVYLNPKGFGCCRVTWKRLFVLSAGIFGNV